MNNIFFMHIPKTAGSFINETFNMSLSENKIINHIESKMPAGTTISSFIEKGYRVISGHVYYHRWLALSKNINTNFMLATSIREPIEQISSHILWLDHYNDPEYYHEYKRLSDQIKKVVDRISVTALNDPRSLDDFITNMPLEAIPFLDNCQSRYFISGFGSPVRADIPLTLKHTLFLDNVLKEFHSIIFQDTLKDDMLLLCENIGMDNIIFPPDKVNIAKSRRTIDINNKTIRKILDKRSVLDGWLWRRAKQLRKERQASLKL